jgi:hypothetical protein
VNGWLVTWECLRLKVTNPVIAIFSLHKSEEFVSEFVWQYYLMASFTGRGVLHYMNRRGKAPFNLQRHVWIKGALHSEITCGGNPFIFARKVSELWVEEDGNTQVFRWRESPIYRFDKKLMRNVVDTPAKLKKLCMKLDALIPMPYE